MAFAFIDVNVSAAVTMLMDSAALGRDQLGHQGGSTIGDIFLVDIDNPADPAQQLRDVIGRTSLVQRTASPIGFDDRSRAVATPGIWRPHHGREASDLDGIAVYARQHDQVPVRLGRRRQSRTGSTNTGQVASATSATRPNPRRHRAAGVDVEHLTFGSPYPGFNVLKPLPPEFDWRKAKSLGVLTEVFELSAHHPDDTYWFQGVGWLNPADVAEHDGKDFLTVCAQVK